MKKIKINGKLNLSKETVSKLNENQMDGVNGGKLILSIGYRCSMRNSCERVCGGITDYDSCDANCGLGETVA